MSDAQHPGSPRNHAVAAIASGVAVGAATVLMTPAFGLEVGAMSAAAAGALATALGFHYGARRSDRQALEATPAVDAASQRILSALDGASTLMMIADADLRIVYINSSLRGMLSEAEADIRKDLPHFSVETLIGENIDVFHQNPAHQRTMLARLDRTVDANIALGGRRFALNVSPILLEGARCGTVVEWRDVTAEMRATEEIDAVVAAAEEGDFSRRADLAGAPAGLRTMGEKLNTVAGSVELGVAEISRVIAAMSEGDLSQRMTGEFKGVFQVLQANANDTVERLSKMMGEIAEMTASVRSSSASFVAGSENLSSRAEQQASSLEETAATMEEMSASIKSNADNSSNAQNLAAGASHQAAEGGDVVKDAVAAMVQIEESASKIADIISVIDGIAFQTNLLALNAAVEAARAGDAGKGFAVVASEVRALAQRSADAAQDIRGLIETSADQVSDGVRLVTKTGEALEGIVASIAQVEDSIRSIAAASREQASGVEEMSTAVGHMDEITQQNSSLAEETAANARGLTGGAEELQKLTAFFQVAAYQDRQGRSA